MYHIALQNNISNNGCFSVRVLATQLYARSRILQAEGDEQRAMPVISKLLGVIWNVGCHGTAQEITEMRFDLKAVLVPMGFSMQVLTEEERLKENKSRDEVEPSLKILRVCVRLDAPIIMVHLHNARCYSVEITLVQHTG